MRTALLLVVLGLWLAPPASAAVTRLVYASDWAGPTEVFAVRPTGGAPVGQLTFGREPACVPEVLACGYLEPVPSPDGRSLLYRGVDMPASIPSAPLSLWVSRTDRSHAVLVARAASFTDFVGAASWSPDSTRFAYVTSAGVSVARRDGSGPHVVSPLVAGSLAWSPDGRALALLDGQRLIIARGGRSHVLAPVRGSSVDWSADGRWLAVSSAGSSEPITLVSSRNGRRRRVGYGAQAKWSPAGRLLASSTHAGLLLIDSRTGRTRLLTTDTAYQDPFRTQPLGFAWAPDGRSLAYLTTKGANDFLAPGDLRTVTLAGHVKTIVSAASAYGGRIVSVAWMRTARPVRYLPPHVAPVSRLADGPVMHLATDGANIAYATSCYRASVWTPATDAAVTFQVVSWLPAEPDCDWGDRQDLYTLALAGDRLAYGFNNGGLSSTWSLRERTLGSNPADIELDAGSGGLGGPWTHALGTALGSGSLLVYSAWDEAYQPAPTPKTTQQTILKVGPAGCPCSALATSPGPLVPYDVAGGRIVASGDIATIVFDEDGRQLLSLPVAALGAQFDGADLVLLVRGELRDYDARSGALLHAWKLPDVESGSECANGHYCDRRPPRLLLEDARDGLVTYVLDGQVHLLRLADGADAVVTEGSLARFFAGGLVYAEGARISVLPFGQLPLRGD